MSDNREKFEAAVFDRLKQSGFLEIEIRTEALVRCGDGYQDEVINAGWHYWNAALVAASKAPPPPQTHLRGDCPECHGTGEVFCHADDCHDDLCALNGDDHSCSGKVEPCGCTSPPQHVEWGDWTVDDTDTAREILNYLGYGSDASREPGADRRRDKIAGMIRARIDAATAPAPSEHVAGVRTVAELQMTAFADAAPQRDEFNGEQTILTYNDKVGVWDLAFFESGEEFPEKWLGDTHWIDITRMWPGVIAQVASFATTEGNDNG